MAKNARITPITTITDEPTVPPTVTASVSDGFRLLVLESSTETNSNENKNLRLDWSEKKINKASLKKCMYRFPHSVKRFNKQCKI